MRSTSALLLLPLVSLCIAVQDSNYFAAKDKSFEIRGFEKIRSFKVDPASQTTKFSGDGNPVKILFNSKGVALDGKSVEGQATQSKSKTYVLDSATVTGAAQITISTAVREDWETVAGKRSEKSPGQTISTVTGDKIVYTGSADLGTATLPGATTVHSVSRGVQTIDRDGKKVQQRFEQIVDITASSGELTFDPASDAGKNNVRKGTFKGPVSIKVVRNERDEDAKEGTVSTYTATGDQLTLDFTGTDRVIKLLGHTKLVSDSNTFAGTLVGDQVTVTVDEDLRPLGYSFDGPPATLRTNPGKDK